MSQHDLCADLGEERSNPVIRPADFLTVAQTAAALRAMGVGKGDRVAAYLPNIPATVVVMLAAASMGAIFSSASPDFGVQGVVDRFGQIEIDGAAARTDAMAGQTELAGPA